MKLYEIWRRSEWTAVANALQRHYPNDARVLTGYQLVWEQMHQMEPTSSPCCLYADPLSSEDHDPDDLPEGDAPAHVYCREPDDADTRYGIDMTPRAEVLAMDVTTATEYSEAEMVAHLLWEVTWHGFEEEEVQGWAAEIRRRVDEINNQTPEEREEQKRRSDEFMKEFLPALWRRQHDQQDDEAD